jgi:hypothetical protein
MSDWIRTASLGWMAGATLSGFSLAAGAIYGPETDLPSLGTIPSFFVAYLAAQVGGDVHPVNAVAALNESVHCNWRDEL